MDGAEKMNLGGLKVQSDGLSLDSLREPLDQEYTVRNSQSHSDRFVYNMNPHDQ
jgi:hypothetical protein